MRMCRTACKFILYIVAMKYSHETQLYIMLVNNLGKHRPINHKPTKKHMPINHKNTAVIRPHLSLCHQSLQSRALNHTCAE